MRNQCFGANARRVGVGGILAVALMLLQAPAASSAPAHFQLPFSCGTVQAVYTYAGHSPSYNSLDMPGGNTPVLASAAGTVVFAGVSGGYGNLVIVDHGGGWRTYYAHLASISVGGGAVAQGQTLGIRGSTGNSTGNHLHYEQRLNNVPQPITFNGAAVRYVNYPDTSVKVTSQNCPSAAAEGAFISHNGFVYRIVGGAPVYVSSWNVYGGPQPTTTVSSLGGFRQYPADGTLVNAAGRVYRFAGGAPIYVSAWSAIGGARASLTIDHAAIDNADGGSPWNHVRRYPADGTLVDAAGYVFRFAGGAPIYVSAWSAIGGPRPSTTIDRAAIDNADGGSPWNHVRRHPANGTLVDAAGRVYRFAGGAPLYVASWSAVGGPQASTTIDHAAIDNADRGFPWAQVRRYPLDGTFVDTQTGRVYRFAGGAAFYISAWSDVGGPKPSTRVDQYTIDRPDDGGGSSHVRRFPIDGTILNGAPSGRYWKVQSNQRSEVSATAGAVRVSDASIEPIPVVK